MNKNFFYDICFIIFMFISILFLFITLFIGITNLSFEISLNNPNEKNTSAVQLEEKNTNEVQLEEKNTNEVQLEEKNLSIEIIYDKNRQKLGSFSPTEGNRWVVKNKNDQVIGYFDSSKTYDKSNNVIAHGKVPGFLLCREQ